MPLFSIIIIDEHGNGVPVGWAIVGKEDIPTVTAALRGWVEALRSRVKGAAEWKPSCTVVDDAATEHGALRCPTLCHLPALCASATHTDDHFADWNSATLISNPGMICRAVFGEDFPVVLCIWHLQRNWLENLSKKVSALRF